MKADSGCASLTPITPFIALKLIEFLSHADPKLNFGMTLKFNFDSKLFDHQREPLILLLECQLEEVFVEFQETFLRFQSESSTFQFEPTAIPSTELNCSLNAHFPEEKNNNSSSLPEHSQKHLFLQLQATFYSIKMLS